MIHGIIRKQFYDVSIEAGQDGRLYANNDITRSLSTSVSENESNLHTKLKGKIKRGQTISLSAVIQDNSEYQFSGWLKGIVNNEQVFQTMDNNLVLVISSDVTLSALTFIPVVASLHVSYSTGTVPESEEQDISIELPHKVSFFIPDISGNYYLKSECLVEDCEDVIAPDIDSEYYVISGWSEDLECISSDISAYALIQEMSSVYESINETILNGGTGIRDLSDLNLSIEYTEEDLEELENFKNAMLSTTLDEEDW